MTHLTLIDQWKCLDIRCGHRWDTTVTYAQLSDEAPSTSGSAGRQPGAGTPAGH